MTRPVRRHPNGLLDGTDPALEWFALIEHVTTPHTRPQNWNRDHLGRAQRKAS